MQHEWNNAYGLNSSSTPETGKMDGPWSVFWDCCSKMKRSNVFQAHSQILDLEYKCGPWA